MILSLIYHQVVSSQQKIKSKQHDKQLKNNSNLIKVSSLKILIISSKIKNCNLPLLQEKINKKVPQIPFQKGCFLIYHKVQSL